MHIPESDWKTLRSLRESALERLCEKALDEISAVAADDSLSSQKRFKSIYQIVDERDDDIAVAFDGPKRSNALPQLTAMVRMKLITDEEFQKFTERTREFVKAVLA